MFRLPDGYKKVMERKIVDVYEVPRAVHFIKESQICAVELLDQILYNAVGTHFLEPTSQVRMVATVKIEQNPRSAHTKQESMTQRRLET